MNNTITELSYFEQVSINQSNRDFWLNIVIAIITFLSVALVYIDYRNRKKKGKSRKIYKPCGGICTKYNS